MVKLIYNFINQYHYNDLNKKYVINAVGPLIVVIKLNSIYLAPMANIINRQNQGKDAFLKWIDAQV